jgi:hypothetical protein
MEFSSAVYDLISPFNKNHPFEMLALFILKIECTFDCTIPVYLP